jgi:hypothetical protein
VTEAGSPAAPLRSVVKSDMRPIARIIIAAIFLSVSICAQQPNWDLSYEFVLERNKVAKSEWIWTWLKSTESPATSWISEWKGKPIISSILIEHPAFHAAERTTTGVIRTEDEAFYWDEVEGTRWGRTSITDCEALLKSGVTAHRPVARSTLFML